MTVVIVVLLALNTVYYVVDGRQSEALDSAAWFALLLLFTLESRNLLLVRAPGLLATARALRLVAAAAIVVAAYEYVTEHEWLDAINILLWIAVVILLEAEVRRPEIVARHRKAYTAIAAVLYSALAALIFVWIARAEWLDAWDATLWLAAFGLLELDLLHANTNVATHGI